MEVQHSRCAGLDVHRDSVVACARIVADGPVALHVRTFGTTTKELMALSEWLVEHSVTHVAMEATGVYWRPVWHVLDGDFELVLANAMHVKNVPGRKTDVNDATWLAELLAHGLIRGSFVPPASVQDLRALTRTRKQLVRARFASPTARAWRAVTRSAPHDAGASSSARRPRASPSASFRASERRSIRTAAEGERASARARDAGLPRSASTADAMRNPHTATATQASASGARRAPRGDRATDREVVEARSGDRTGVAAAAVSATR
jgi:hypothetical protein